MRKAPAARSRCIMICLNDGRFLGLGCLKGGGYTDIDCLHHCFSLGSFVYHMSLLVYFVTINSKN